MNTEETSEQRLKQIEILLATAAKTLNRTDERLDRLTERIDQLTERQDRTAEAIDRLTERQDFTFLAIDRLTERQDRSDERIDRLTIRMGEISEYFAETVKIIRDQQVNIDKMSSEIRGLQVENQRILLKVFGGEEYLDPN